MIFLISQKEAIYGLTEIHREEIRKARLVANPGCYPTSVLLPLVPLIEVMISLSFVISAPGVHLQQHIRQ